MAYSFNLGNVSLKELKESGIYEQQLIEALEQENFEYLERADVKEKCENLDFVQPLLYACINSRKAEMFQIYKHLEDKVQTQLLTDYNLSCNILLNAPEVIKDTPLSESKNVILANVNEKPEIIAYMSDKLVEDPQFVAEISQKNPKVVREMIKKEPSLINNPEFMMEAIKQDPSLLQHTSKEILNNYEVFSNSSKENNQVADYVLQHIEEFGDNAIKGTRDGSTEGLRIDTVDMLKELLEKYGDDGNIGRQLKHFESQDKEGCYELKAKSLVQIIVKSRWMSLDENELNKIFNIVDLDKALLERQLRENPELVISQEQFGALPTPSELDQIIEKSQLEDKGIFAERLVKYREFYDMAKEAVSKEREPKEKQEVVYETQEERDERLRTPDVKSVAAKHFDKARELVEKKEKLYTPEFFRRLLEKSELKDDKESIAWLEQYTKYYEQIQEKTDAKVPEHNAEVSVSAITLTVNDKGIEKVITYDHTMPDRFQLTPEQMHQLEVDLAARTIQKENIREDERPKRGIEALREQSAEKTGPEI